MPRPRISSTAIAEAELDDDELIRRGEELVQPFLSDLASAHSRIVGLAKGLAAAKRKYPNTARFGAWLASSPYNELGDTARAALIKLGEHEAEAEPILRTTKSASPELICGAKSRLRGKFRALGTRNCRVAILSSTAW